MNRKDIDFPSKLEVSSPPPANGGGKKQMHILVSGDERQGLERMKEATGCGFHEYVRRAIVHRLEKDGWLGKVEKAPASKGDRRRQELKLPVVEPFNG